MSDDVSLGQRFRIGGLLILIGLAAAGCQPQNSSPGSRNTAATPPGDGGSDTGDASLRPTLQLEFPEVDGWTRSDPMLSATPRGGYRVEYQSAERTKVTVYVYRGDREPVPANLEDPVVQQEFRKSREGIFQGVRAGFYRFVKQLEEGTATLGENGPAALHSGLVVQLREGQPASSHLYLFGYQDHFIKIRYTKLRDPASDPQRQAAVDHLLARLGQLFVADQSKP